MWYTQLLHLYLNWAGHKVWQNIVRVIKTIFKPISINLQFSSNLKQKQCAGLALPTTLMLKPTESTCRCYIGKTYVDEKDIYMFLVTCGLVSRPAYNMSK